MKDWEKQWDKMFASKLTDIAWSCGKDKGTENDSAKDFIKSVLWSKDIELRNMKLRFEESDALRKQVKSETHRFVTRLGWIEDLEEGDKNGK